MTYPHIAITGLLRSGKNAVADYLTQNYGYTQFAFGDELKRYYHELFGPSETKPREGYQWFGQTMRERDPDIWVRKCFERINGREYLEDYWAEMYGLRSFRAVISDLRQPNEFDRCRSEGYTIIRVTAPEALRIDRAIKSADNFALADLTHDTESHVDSFAVDYEIVNDGTLADLYAKVDGIIGGMRDVTA
ncbi:adenylate kinase [Paenibacillus campinasensis]|uniref:Adenylate kinase n=1 Tax=Paenibacillus campinasensis TaxID=66347 RepID=A0A268EH31_9BACL|nr:adenylate kinase [Paenibacillus campinasensis]PAD72423.1 adenylate kinase [Paenibacillus campinasensis]